MPTPSLARFHRRTRRRSPRLQAVAFAVVAPLLLLAARVRLRGRDRLPDGGFLAVANHPSVLDGLFVALALAPRRPAFMGMSELFAGRFAGLLSRLGVFPVRRGTWDEEAFETARAVLDRGGVLVVFPEGGVSPPDGLRPARGGAGHIAHRAGATVVPVHLSGTRRLYRPWTWPRVVVTVGEPLAVEQDPEPSRERSEATAQRLLDAVAALGT